MLEQPVRRLCPSLALVVLMMIVFGCASIPPEEAAVINSQALPQREVMPSEGPPEEAVRLTAKSTLKDYLLYAALNNPGLKAAFLRWEAALEKIPQVTSLPDPHFTYGYFIQEMMNQHESFALEQTFPWFGKLALEGDAATEAARAEKARYDAARLKLFYQVKDAYYEYYYLAKATGVTKENLGYVKYLESVARAGYASGMTPYADVVRAEVELGKLEDSLKTLDDQAGPVAARLNAALNRPPDATLFWPEKIEEEKASFTSGQLFAWLEESNPELKALTFEAAGAKWRISRAKKDYYPDLSVEMQGVSMMQGKDAVLAMATVNLPVWRSKYEAEVKEATAKYESLLKDRSDRENSLAADVKFADYKFKDAERKIALYSGALIPEAKQAFAVSLQAYQTGKETYTGVVDSIRNLLEFELSYQRALADREKGLAELEMLVGRTVTATGK